MIKRWIEPAIVEKVETVAADVYGNEQLRDVQQRFERAVKSMGDKQLADDANSLFNLACAVSVELAFREGFNEGMELGNHLGACWGMRCVKNV